MIILRHIILIIIISALPSLVQAATVTAGSACHSITPSQATKFEWRTEGIKNGDTRNNWWVNCPIQRPTGTNELEVSLRVFNGGNSTVSFECNFREMFEGGRLQGSPVSANIGPNTAETLSWVMSPREAKSVVNAACRLPNGLQIEAILAGYAGSGSGGSSGNRSDVYACITSPDEYYVSSENTVTMKNGMQVNNYDGRSWGSDDSHLVFKTVSGKWYTLEEKNEIYRLDVISEPTSCFVPDFYEVIDKYAGGDYGYILETTGGNAQIEEGCGINVGAQVYSFVAKYTSQYYLLDLLTNTNCKIWAP